MNKLIKKKYLSKKNYQVLETISALGISLLTKELVKKGWKKITKTPPPENPYSTEASVREVILFSVSLALVSTSIKLLTRSKFAKQWDKLEGELPKNLS
ncbi:DUF4235 domain-containing protein [Marivirga sp. S37H4]|uniref:DUF4235 domain-containing protein n=1 Tax=Marivirga aurantiaca TaxID=2802615 RepID=A0A934WZB9_9BACT|nr:DUF4235 domain-containing protein [Marivirga aurantiaca]MBK6265979.1 DUF4235 domain-containing protein [Marivirga aurantiaca]